MITNRQSVSRSHNTHNTIHDTTTMYGDGHDDELKPELNVIAGYQMENWERGEGPVRTHGM